MKDQAQRNKGPARWLRGVVGFAGVALGALLAAALTALFDDASSMHWLQPTPANVAAVARCDHVLGTAARAACVETVVEAVQARSTRTRLASAAAASDAAQASE